MRQTPYESQKNIYFFQLRQIKPKLANTIVNIDIETIQEAEPENLIQSRVVIYKNCVFFSILKLYLITRNSFLNRKMS